MFTGTTYAPGLTILLVNMQLLSALFQNLSTLTRLKQLNLAENQIEKIGKYLIELSTYYLLSVKGFERESLVTCFRV